MQSFTVFLLLSNGTYRDININASSKQSAYSLARSKVVSKVAPLKITGACVTPAASLMA